MTLFAGLLYGACPERSRGVRNDEAHPTSLRARSEAIHNNDNEAERICVIGTARHEAGNNPANSVIFPFTGLGAYSDARRKYLIFNLFSSKATFHVQHS
jgi:hypothetical protein